MKIGCARVSTGEHNLALQIDALKAAGAERIFEDHGVSGATVRLDRRHLGVPEHSVPLVKAPVRHRAQALDLVPCERTSLFGLVKLFLR